MVFAASERAAQIHATGIPWMSQKPNPAGGAVCLAFAQFGIRTQDRIQSGLVLTHEPIDAIVLVPILAKRENFPDRDTKEPGSRLGYRDCFSHPRPTSTTRKLREEGRGFFMQSDRFRIDGQHKRLSDHQPRKTTSLPRQRSFRAPDIFKALLGNKKPKMNSFFPRSGSV